MPFIGQQPITGAYSKLDSITTSATATYNLQLNGGAYYPQSANHLLVSLNGVMQAPQDSFTVSGSQITFASALTSSDNIDFIMALGDVLDIGTPSDGSVNTSQLANNAVTMDKLATSGTLPALNGSALTGVNPITEIDSWEMGTAFSPAGSAYITSNWQRTNDSAFEYSGTGLTESSGVFSFPSTGKYFISYIGYFDHNGNDGFVGLQLHVTTDNSTYGGHGTSAAAGNRTTSDPTMSSSSFALLDVTDTTNVKFKFEGQSLSPCSLNRVQFYCLRIGDT